MTHNNKSNNIQDLNYNLAINWLRLFDSDLFLVHELPKKLSKIKSFDIEIKFLCNYITRKIQFRVAKTITDMNFNQHSRKIIPKRYVLTKFAIISISPGPDVVVICDTQSLGVATSTCHVNHTVRLQGFHLNIQCNFTQDIVFPFKFSNSFLTCINSSNIMLIICIKNEYILVLFKLLGIPEFALVLKIQFMYKIW